MWRARMPGLDMRSPNGALQSMRMRFGRVPF
jgi:hypothetical protein